MSGSTNVERRPVLLLVNPVAGGKPASAAPLSEDPERLAPNALAGELRARGLEVQLRVLAEGDDAGELAGAAMDRHDIVVAGGDGTVGPVGIAMAGSDATLGILALGSFNNIARGLGVPATLDHAIEVIARGDATAVDVAVAEREGADPEPFLEAGGVGLDAVGFHAVQLVERRGLWRGLRFLRRALLRRSVAIELTVDGQRTVTHAPTVVVCNGPFHGPGFAVAPDADPTDGSLDVAIFHAMGRLQTIGYLLRVARGRPLRDPRIRVERGVRIGVRTLRGTLPVQVDGRSIGVTPISFTIQEKRVRVFR